MFEDYLFDYYVEERDRIEGATAKLAALDLSALPADIKRNLGQTVKGVGTFTLVEVSAVRKQLLRRHLSTIAHPCRGSDFERDIRAIKKRLKRSNLKHAAQ